MKLARYMRILLLAAAVLAVPASSYAGIFIGISVGVAPPPLPVYEQPPLPAAGYMWTPGYWAWSDDGGYYWVPGTWIQPPTVGLLWTPGYWGWSGGAYAFNAGYWGPHVGFYGGVNYGFGFGGVGYEGGAWRNGSFAYNSSVNNISNVHVTNVYNTTVVNNTTVNRTSFNGGTGGVQARPTAQEQAAAKENHVQPTREQVQHVTQAQNNPQLRASVNGGKPAIAATARPGDFKSAVPAKQAGGQVDTSVYKAAAQNHGKLPAGMKDPGSVRPASATTTRPNNGAAINNNRAANTTENQPRTNKPLATENKPATENSHPATESKPAVISNHPATQTAKPATQAKPASQPAPQPKPQTQPSHPQQQPHPQQQQHPQQQKPAPKPAPQHEEKPK